MSNTYQRRQVIKQGLSGLAGLSLFGLAGCSTNSTSFNNMNNPVPAQLASGTLHMLFWGSTTRDQLTRATFDLFHQQNPTFTITSNYYSFNDYFNKLDALIASGNTPDLIQMDMRYIAQYVRRRQLMDLTETIYNQAIDLSDFDPLLLNSSKVNNTIYGVPLGGNYQSMFYNAELVDKAGIGEPPVSFNWDSYAAYVTELTKALGETAYGSEDLSKDPTTFELWIRRTGKEMYTRDGQVNFTQEDVGDWFNYWNNLRKAGGCLPWSIQKNMDISGTPSDSSLVHGRAVFMVQLSNLFESFQIAARALSPTRVFGLMTPPSGGLGLYLKASMLLSIAANTKYQQTAVKYTNFIFNDENAIKKLGIERGTPGSTQALSLLQPQLTPVERTIANYVTTVSNSGLTGAKTVLDPPGAGKVQSLLTSTANDIASGSLKVSQGAQSFYSQSKKVAPTG